MIGEINLPHILGMHTRDVMVAEGRTRMRRAAKKQAQAAEKWDPTYNRWQKYAKCSICLRRFVVNNYNDRKARVNKHKVAGKIVCPWCMDRGGKYIIQLRLIVEKVANTELSYCNGTPKDPNCKCLSCIAGRVLAAHDDEVTRL